MVPLEPQEYKAKQVPQVLVAYKVTSEQLVLQVFKVMQVPRVQVD
jgi:hypothetical protein